MNIVESIGEHRDANVDVFLFSFRRDKRASYYTGINRLQLNLGAAMRNIRSMLDIELNQYPRTPCSLFAQL